MEIALPLNHAVFNTSWWPIPVFQGIAKLGKH
jgi:hypothetical protein